MTRIPASLLIPVLLILGGSLLAQPQGPPPVSVGYEIEVEMGNVLAFEKVLKEHMQYLASQGEKWTWYTWMPVAGDLGGYYIGSFGHTFAEMDQNAEIRQKSRIHFLQTMAPLVKSISSDVSALRPDLSRMPTSTTPPAMVMTFKFELHPGCEQQFEEGVKSIGAALQKENALGPYIWYQTVTGGPLPGYVVVIPGDKWESFDPSGTSMDSAMEKVYGAQNAKMIMGSLSKCIKSELSGVAALRSDLSYFPNQP